VQGTSLVRIALVLAMAALIPEVAADAPACARAAEGSAPADPRALLAAAPPEGARAPSRPPSDLPLEHWAYPILERLVARRVLEIELATRPVSRAAVARALRSLPDPVEGRELYASLTERERWALGRLRAEFLAGWVDAPTVSVREGGSVVALGVLLGSAVRYADGCLAGRDSVAARPVRGGDEEPVSASIDVSYELWGGVGNALGFYSDAAILVEEQDGPRTARLSKRARTWRGATVTIDRAYVKYERSHVAVALGRRGPAWGRSARGRLLLSGSAPTFDQIDASLTVGPLGFHAFHAMLEYDETGAEELLGPSDHVFLAGHRLAFSGRRGSVGLNEVVVYGSGIPDPAYLNPLLPYYVSQHNERANDNVLWSADFTWRPAVGLELYGEFLVDDLQYDRDTERPDKYAMTIGQAYYSHAIGLDYRVVLEYSHARKWTYTHARVEHRYEHDGRPIGFDLGPDADRGIMELSVHPSPAWSVTLGYEHARKGEGTLTEAFVEGEESEPAFPSGSVRTRRRVALEVVRDNLEGFSYGFGAAYEDRSKEGDGSLEDEDGWEVWIGAEFRI
jgi:hypothetical protein